MPGHLYDAALSTLAAGLESAGRYVQRLQVLHVDAPGHTVGGAHQLVGAVAFCPSLVQLTVQPPWKNYFDWMQGAGLRNHMAQVTGRKENLHLLPPKMLYSDVCEMREQEEGLKRRNRELDDFIRH